MKKSVYWKWGLTAFLTVCAILVFYDAFYQGGTLQHILGKLAEVLAPVFYGVAMAYLLMPLEAREGVAAGGRDPADVGSGAGTAVLVDERADPAAD